MMSSDRQRIHCGAIAGWWR